MSPSSEYPRLHALVVEPILDQTSLAAVHALMHTNLFWYHECRYYIRRMQTHLLRQYIANHDQFREIMRRTSSILTGSEILNFALHATEIPIIQAQDLNIYTTPLHFGSLIRYLRHVEGYYISPVPMLQGDWFSEDSFLDDADFGIGYSKDLVHTGRRKRIVVTCSPRLSATFSIAHAPSTLEMNYMTADRLVLAYPTLTLEGIGVLSPIFGENHRRDAYRRRVIQRGLTLVSCPAQEVCYLTFNWYSLVEASTYQHPRSRQ